MALLCRFTRHRNELASGKQAAGILRHLLEEAIDDVEPLVRDALNLSQPLVDQGVALSESPQRACSRPDRSERLPEIVCQ
jgi:hypothetical protein